MNEVKQKKWASALMNDDYYFIETYSGYRRSGADPLGKRHTLASNAATEILGATVLDVLNYSRFLSLEELDDFFDYEKSKKNYEAWVRTLMEQHDYKSRRALFKNMACCSIIVMVDERSMEIVPMRHNQLEGWSREKDDGIENVHLSADASALEVGQALQLAFSRCA